MERWTDQELGSIDLGDRRLNQRAAQLVYALAERPEASIPQACSGWDEVKAAYRFLANPRVSATALRDAHHTSTLGRVREEETVLVVQDTTTLDFTTHRSVRGLGPLDHWPTGGIWGSEKTRCETDWWQLGVTRGRGAEAVCN
jgi:hypothetical protein